MQETGKVLLHRNLRSEPERFLQAVKPYRDDLVVGASPGWCVPSPSEPDRPG